ncbi:ras-GEF domain-containing family member 1B-B-like, partial [Ctenocephalides felis]|uniref:ras-GEF domain-containing family member 1B-B-like n=1 Tax=Ctenocephalides felis TaxID=7515 RepID=UPI000E6E3CE1
MTFNTEFEFMDSRLNQAGFVGSNLSLCIDANHLSTELGRIESERLYHIGYEEYLAMEACLARASGRIAISTRSGSVRIRLKKLWNLECFLDWIDRLVLLAANEVCQPTTAASRATMLQLWVNTAQCCQLSGRVLTCAAIVAALTSEVVQRLRET